MQNKSLRRLIIKYKDNSGKSNAYEYGKWRLGIGGYDLWFEIYYNNVPVIQCIDGQLEVCNKNIDINMDYDEAIKTIKEILPYLKS